MNIGDRYYRTIWCDDPTQGVNIIDQTRLPFELSIARLNSSTDAFNAIRNMLVRGAPLVGATAAYGIALAMRDDPSTEKLTQSTQYLNEARPTAVNLVWALQRMQSVMLSVEPEERAARAFEEAANICDEDVALCESMGDYGLEIIKKISAAKSGATVNILTHCNAGWLATVDWGTALAPIYKAQNAGIDVHVWVDETRPRNQGAYLSAYELGKAGVKHTVIVDNAGGHLMQHGLVDVCFVGTDRTTRSGDVCNKIGTYLKALAAFDNNVPFYVCAPSPSIDFTIDDGLADIPIEQRSPREVSHILGRSESGEIVAVDILPEGSAARNDAFDVTPAKYITGLVTEKGVVAANKEAITAAFSERMPTA
ncbi:S-methyl-5-thioribose-1-phosphate isomerase [Granulosicoccus sp.]|nr:S-methyl-5-thioribose-1-phosphate isomerase [Granulosicoccus sp.]MDB4222214.1 S-methyl-5-thioribose-1-phosphate isomerase [Granulosicoccus sp.]